MFMLLIYVLMWKNVQLFVSVCCDIVRHFVIYNVVSCYIQHCRTHSTGNTNQMPHKYCYAIQLLSMYSFCSVAVAALFCSATCVLV